MVRIHNEEPFFARHRASPSAVGEIMCVVMDSKPPVTGRECWFKSSHVVGVRFCSSSFKSELPTKLTNDKLATVARNNLAIKFIGFLQSNLTQ